MQRRTVVDVEFVTIRGEVNSLAEMCDSVIRSKFICFGSNAIKAQKETESPEDAQERELAVHAVDD